MQIISEKYIRCFEDALKIKFEDNKLRVRLVRDFWVKFYGWGIASIVTVPEDYVSDGMSIPRFLQPFIGEPFEGNTLKAALIHDYLCSTRSKPQLITHCLFRAMLIRDGVNPVRAWFCWLGVFLYNFVKNRIIPVNYWKML